MSIQISKSQFMITKLGPVAHVNKAEPAFINNNPILWHFFKKRNSTAAIP